MRAFFVAILAGAVLAACSSTPTSEQPAAGVEDRTPGQRPPGVDTNPVGQKPPTGIDLTTKPRAVNPLQVPGSILSRRSVFFDFDKYDVKDEYKPLLEAHGQYLRGNPGAKMLIQGNTDERGGREYNLALGQRRADAHEEDADAARRPGGPDRIGEPRRGETACPGQQRRGLCAEPARRHSLQRRVLMLRSLAFAIAVALASAAAPARAGLFDDEEARRQIANLQRLVDAQQKRLEGIEAEARDRRALLDLATQIELLRGDLAKMRGQLELLANQADNADKRQKDLYVDIDARLRKLEQQKEKEAAAAEKPAAGPAEPAAAETKAYEAALNQFKLANYPLAISTFNGFLVTYPSSPLAPSAQYWIGNAHYAQRDYKNTIAAQQKVLANWPDNPKAADAMLNMASAQAESGDARGARRTLEALVAKYPASPAAASAKQRLAQPAAKR